MAGRVRRIAGWDWEINYERRIRSVGRSGDGPRAGGDPAAAVAGQGPYLRGLVRERRPVAAGGQGPAASASSDSSYEPGFYRVAEPGLSAWHARSAPVPLPGRLAG